MVFSTKLIPEGEVPPERRLHFQKWLTTCLVPPDAGLSKILGFTWE